MEWRLGSSVNLGYEFRLKLRIGPGRKDGVKDQIGKEDGIKNGMNVECKLYKRPQIGYEMTVDS